MCSNIRKRIRNKLEEFIAGRVYVVKIKGPRPFEGVVLTIVTEEAAASKGLLQGVYGNAAQVRFRDILADHNAGKKRGGRTLTQLLCNLGPQRNPLLCLVLGIPKHILIERCAQGLADSFLILVYIHKQLELLCAIQIHKCYHRDAVFPCICGF